MKERPLTKSSCKYYGKQHAPGKCPTYGEQCKNCRKQNHFASVCKLEHRVNQFVTYASDDSDVDTTNDFFIGNVTSGSKSILRVVKMRPPQSRGWCEVECQLDTGASCNVMSKEDFFRISGKRNLRGQRRSDARLHLYDASIMKPLGRYTLKSIVV